LRLGAPELFLQGSVYLAQAAFSLDGRWLAYVTSETGRSEVYVRPFPRLESAHSGRSQISIAGGLFPSWRRGELFFLGLDGRIMMANYTADRDVFTAGKPQVWSAKPVARTLAFYSYAMAADGKRAAVVLYAGETAEPQQRSGDSVTVLLNFFDELKRRVPVGGQ
jgi:serine/threonine-protein kinase